MDLIGRRNKEATATHNLKKMFKKLQLIGAKHVQVHTKTWFVSRMVFGGEMYCNLDSAACSTALCFAMQDTNG